MGFRNKGGFGRNRLVNQSLSVLFLILHGWPNLQISSELIDNLCDFLTGFSAKGIVQPHLMDQYYIYIITRGCGCEGGNWPVNYNDP